MGLALYCPPGCYLDKIGGTPFFEFRVPDVNMGSEGGVVRIFTTLERFYLFGGLKLKGIKIHRFHLFLLFHFVVFPVSLIKEKLLKIKVFRSSLFDLVNSAGVEPTTSWAVTKCSIH